MYEQNENPWDGQKQPYRNPPSNNILATAALACAVIGIVSVCCLYGAFVFGGLAIVLGLLSRGAKKKAQPPARAAIYIGIVAVVLSSVITAASVFTMIHRYGSFENLMDAYTYTLENSFGIDLNPDDNSASDLYDENEFL